MTRSTKGPARQASGPSTGILFGLLTVAAWSLYNVGSKIGQLDGFRSMDLVFLRFAVGGLVMLPVVLCARSRVPIGGQRLAVLTVFSGPLFVFLMAQGFAHAPLSHGVVIAPTTSMLVTTLLVWKFDGAPPSRLRLTGMAVMVLSLFLVGLESGAGSAPTLSPLSVLQGDAAFMAGASMWGLYTYLVGRWRLPPLQVASELTLLSGLIAVPAYLALAEPPTRPVSAWLEQAFYQGACGGSLAFLGFAQTIGRLGAARASLFFAMVPPVALLLAIPLMGVLPSGFQAMAILLSVGGMLVSLRGAQGH